MMEQRNTYKNRIGKALLGALTVCVLLLPLSPARAAADITTGLVGYWRLDETNGPFADDIAGNSATEVNNTAAVAAQSGGGQLCENANSAYITAPAQQTYRDLRTLTVSFWTRLDDFGGFSGWLEIIGLLQVRNNYGTGRVEFHADAWNTQGGSWRASSDSQLPQGQWAHVAMTYDYNQPVGTPPVIYINGQPVGYTTPFSPSGSITPPADGTLYICGVDNAGIRELKGAIDDVRIYDRVLTQEDITELYRSWDGNIDYNVDARVPEYYNGDQWITMGPSAYVPNAVFFDGANDYLRQTSFGGSDQTYISGSFWFRRDASNLGVSQTIATSANASGEYFRVRFNTSNELVIDGQETGVGAYNLLARSNTQFTDGNWHHAMFSIDSTNRLLDQIYIDGVSDVTSLSATYSAFGAGDSFNVGGFATTGTEKLYGDLADLWIDFDNYIDFSNASNRRKFIDAGGAPVYLGPDGALPTGSAPDVFLSGDTATWHLNKGAGGGFTENGALTDALTTPMNVDVTSGLVGHWKLDEGSGTAVADSSTSGNDGSMINGLSGANSEVGEIGNALHFDGTDDGIEIPNSASLQPANAVTMATWVKFDAPSSEVIIAKQVGTGSGAYRNSYTIVISNAGTRVTGYIGNSGNLAGLPYDYDFQPNIWYHVAYTFDDPTNATTLYLDGQEVASGTTSQSMGYNTSPVTIGFDYEGEAQTSPGYYFDGLIDDVRIYNRALSAAEINALYNKTSVCSGPAGYGGKIIYNADGQVLQYCDGANWRAMGPYPGAGTGGCSNPTRAEGSLIFNRDYSVMQYCDGDEWVSVGNDISACATGSSIGTVCSDGTVYAGISPDGDTRMYTTAADEAGTYAWNNGNGAGTWTDVYSPNCIENGPGSVISTCITGAANTALMVATDSDTSTAGIQPHQAAQQCHDLVAHGKSDWYLPAQEELWILYNNRTAIGGFTANTYWSSSEDDAFDARRINFSNGAPNNTNKDTPLYVRCVRKD